MKVSSLGEYNLIRRIIKGIGNAEKTRSSIVLGPGDDAFAVRFSANRLMVATKDMLIENTHFKRTWAEPWQVGYKALAVNISDLAAMGNARPLFCLVGLGLPEDISVDFVDKLYKGMNKIASKYKLQILGGDTVSVKKDIVISITLIGDIESRYLVSRSGARPGDVLLVTGTFGDSAAGLVLLSKALKRIKHHEKYLINRHYLPEPRLKEAGKLSRTGKISSMIDSSDGLAVSARLICESSNVGARIDLENIPVSNQLKKAAKERKDINILDLSVNGGEEYELVFTSSPENLPLLRKILPGITKIGEIVKGRGVRYFLNGHIKKIFAAGFEHFQ